MMKKAYLLANMILPLLVGAMFYFLTSKDVIFVEMASSFLGKPLGIEHAGPYDGVFMFIRYYMLDALWAYALVFAMFISIGNNAARVKTAFMVAIFFSVAMEVIQLFPVVPGTFDAIDILVEVMAEVIAALIIKTQYEEARNICIRR